MRFLDKDDPRRAVWEACCCPLEQMLCSAMFALLGCLAVRSQFHRSRLPDLAKLCGGKPACFLFGQHAIGPYRTDFLLVTLNPTGRRYRPLIVECDDERYHSSAATIAVDQQRTLHIKAAGYRVMRFTESNIEFGTKEVLDEIQAWIEAGGCSCEPPTDLRTYSEMLALFTPSQLTWMKRAEARTEYWRELAIEHRILAGIIPGDL